MNVYQYEQASLDHPDRNEDAVMVFMGGAGFAPVFAVIDGMGGHQRTRADGSLVSGRDASQLVRQTLIEDLQRLPPDIDASPGALAEQYVHAALVRAHQRVWSELNSIPDLPLNHCVGAVATVMVVCENGGRVLAAQVGDTRGYVYSDGELIQICYDEDNIEFMVKNGIISADDGSRITDILNAYDGTKEPQVKGSMLISGNPYELYIAWRWFVTGNAVLNIPPANIVMNALGIETEQPVPQVSRMEITPDDVLFLASDGVYKNLTTDEMAAALKDPNDPAAAAGNAAYARSQRTDNGRATKDDISAVVVRF